MDLPPIWAWVTGGTTGFLFDPPTMARLEGAPWGVVGTTVYSRDDMTTRFRPSGTSWVAWRCFEHRPAGRFRFARSPPSHFSVSGQPLLPQRSEAEWLVSRVKEEIPRNPGIVSREFIEGDERSLRFHEALVAASRK
jgi:hypothetical protein